MIAQMDNLQRNQDHKHNHGTSEHLRYGIHRLNVARRSGFGKLFWAQTDFLRARLCDAHHISFRVFWT